MASDRHLKALGLVTYNSGQLELFARETLVMLSGDRTVGTILVGDRSLDQILELIVRVGPVRIQNQELLARLVAAVERARQANRLRNDLVHSHWTLTDEESSPLRGRLKQRGKRGSVVNMRRTTPDEIGAVADQIRDATEQLGEAMMEYQKGDASQTPDGPHAI